MGKIIRTMESPKVFGEIVCRIPLTFLPRHVDQVGRQDFSSINLGHIFMRLHFFLCSSRWSDMEVQNLVICIPSGYPDTP